MPAPRGLVDGRGVGFFHAGEVLHKKRPVLDAAAPSWQAVFDGVQSNVAIAHLRTGTTGGARADNTHPFRMRQWLFAHHGDVPNYERIRDALLSPLPDFLRRNIRGETDSEHLFHVLLAALHQEAQLDAMDPAEETVFRALRTTMQTLDNLLTTQAGPPAVLNFALTNGRDLYLTARGAPLYMVEREGAQWAPDDPEERAVGAIRYVTTFTSDSNELPTGYTKVPDNHIVRINRQLVVSTHPLAHE